MSVGHADTILPHFVDRHNNPAGDTVVYTATGPATVSGSIITATGFGAIRVSASVHGTVIDTLTIGAVPTGTVAGEPLIDYDYSLALFTLDGKQGGSVAFFAPEGNGEFSGTAHWAPNGASIVFDQNGGLGGPPTQIVSASSAGVSVLLTGMAGSPIYSRDGKYIYYANYAVANGLWRMNPDGTGDSAVAMQVPEPVWSPSPSPDGTRIAYIASGWKGNGPVKVLNVSTGVATSLGVQAVHVRWSPNSETIAYATAVGGLALVQSSGSGNTVLATGPFTGGFDWSPDGQWLIIADGLGAQLDIVNSTTGAIIPEFYITQLTFSNPEIYPVADPTWAPPAPSLQRVRAARTLRGQRRPR